MLPSKGKINVYDADELGYKYRRLGCVLTVVLGLIPDIMGTPVLTPTPGGFVSMAFVAGILLSFVLCFWFASVRMTRIGMDIGIILSLLIEGIIVMEAKGMLVTYGAEGIVSCVAGVAIITVLVTFAILGETSNMMTLFQRTNQSYNHARHWWSYLVHPVAWRIATIGRGKSDKECRYVLIDGDYVKMGEQTHRHFVFDLKDVLTASLPDDDDERDIVLKELTPKSDAMPAIHDDSVIPASRIEGFDKHLFWIEPFDNEPTSDEYYGRY